MGRESEEIMRDFGMNKAQFQRINDGVKEILGECSRVLVFDSDFRVIACTFDAIKTELKALSELNNDRDNAIRKGIVLDKKKYEVHRHHPPLVYGRSMDGEPENSEGAVVCKVDKSVNGKGAMWVAATYTMPFVSARMVPLVQEFARKCLCAAQ